MTADLPENIPPKLREWYVLVDELLGECADVDEFGLGARDALTTLRTQHADFMTAFGDQIGDNPGLQRVYLDHLHDIIGHARAITQPGFHRENTEIVDDIEYMSEGFRKIERYLKTPGEDK